MLTIFVLESVSDTSGDCRATDLLQLVVRLEVLLALRADVAVVNMLPELVRVVMPVLTNAAIAALAHRPSPGLTAVL